MQAEALSKIAEDTPDASADLEILAIIEDGRKGQDEARYRA